MFVGKRAAHNGELAFSNATAGGEVNILDQNDTPVVDAVRLGTLPLHIKSKSKRYGKTYTRRKVGNMDGSASLPNA